MSLQQKIKTFAERLGKPFRKRLKLGEEEDDWCDALNQLSVESDEEYFDAPEPEVKLLHTGTKRKRDEGREQSENELDKNSEMARPYTTYTSGMRSRSPPQSQVSHALYLSAIIYIILQ